MARRRDYAIIRTLIRTFYALGVLVLVVSLALAAYLAVRAEALRDGVIMPGPLADLLHRYSSSELCVVAAVTAGVGLLGFLILGSIGQILAMQRDQAINTSLQVQLLEDILELNEEVAKSAHAGRVDLCDGCGRLGSLQQIQSKQWICRECRRQLRTA